jgi:hypothetical protein
MYEIKFLDNAPVYLPLVNTYYRVVTRLRRRVSLVEQELLTLPQHLSSPRFLRVRVTRSLVLYVCFVYRCLSFCTFSFGHCVVCSSSIYGFVITLWYLQTLLSLDPSFFLIPMKIEANSVIIMNEERTWKCLRQVEHIRDHL